MKKFNFDKNKKSFILSLLLLVAVVGTAGTVALAVAKSNGVKNTFQAADNNTGIEEPGEGTPENKKVSVRNESSENYTFIRATITVGEGSEDCYLRVQITTSGLTPEQEQQILETTNLASDWQVGTDGYLYFQSKAEANDVVPVFDTITIPATWGNEVADLKFEINILAEAIQADYFEPMTDDLGQITGWVDEKGNDIKAETYDENNMNVQ